MSGAPTYRVLVPRCIVWAVSACGCAGLWSSGTLVRRADQLVREAERAVDEDREDRLRRARAGRARETQRTDERFARELAERFGDLSAVSLADAYRMATAYNREYAAERDANLTEALSFIQTRHDFDVRLSGSISSILASSKADGASPTEEGRTDSASLGLSRKTTWGTTVSADVSATGVSGDPAGEDSTSLSVSVSQPLLKGAGRLINREPLTQAERSMVYRLRAFELFRQSFAIRTTRQYYDLVRQKQVVANTRRTFERADFLYRRAQALFRIGRVPEIDVFQAEQQRLQAENNLRDAEEGYKDSLLGFKTFLGVPDDVALDIRSDERPPFHEVETDVGSAIDLAYRNRLDLATERDRLEDAERGHRITRKGLLPDLSLSLSADTSARSPAALADLESHSASARLTLELPLDRLAERVAVRKSLLSLEAKRRQYTLFRDNLAAEVRRLLRNLRRIEQSTAIQEKILGAAGKRLKVAEIRFRQGRLPSRDVVEAQEELLQAQNAHVRYEVDYAIAELEFRRATGVLRIGPDGAPLPGSAAADAPAKAPERGEGAGPAERGEQ